MSAHYDAVIVGGGIVGAMTAKILAEAGKRVLILEAGVEGAMKPANYQAYLQEYYVRGGMRGMPNGPYPANQAAPSPGMPWGPDYYAYDTEFHFASDYLRMLGGTTLHWQGSSIRMVPNDFRMETVYGKGRDWPIAYDDLEPAYRRAEYEIGVAADVADQSFFGVWFADGYVYPMHRMPQSMVDQFFDRAVRGKSVKLHGGRYPLKVMSIPQGRNSTPNPAYDNGRGYAPASMVGDRDEGQRCQGNSACLPLCPVQAKYSALRTLNDLRGSRRVEIRTQCVASRLIVDEESGRITGVEYKRYADAASPAHTTETAHGTLVVLAANAIENATLLLASGAGNRSGQVGRNLMDHPYLYAWGTAPTRVYPFRGPDTTSGIESLRDGNFRKKHAAFRASLANWGWSGEPSNQIGALLGEQAYGRRFRETLADRLTRMVKVGFMFELLPSANNRVAIDPARRRRDGQLPTGPLVLGGRLLARGTRGGDELGLARRGAARGDRGQVVLSAAGALLRLPGRHDARRQVVQHHGLRAHRRDPSHGKSLARLRGGQPDAQLGPPEPLHQRRRQPGDDRHRESHAHDRRTRRARRRGDAQGSRMTPARKKRKTKAATRKTARAVRAPKPITTIPELQAHLQTALELEHATIPPYFTAWLSIKEGTNVEAAHVIRSVMLEEMLHLTLAANLLNAVRGTPRLTRKGFVPRYPARLPHSGETFEVSIEPFSRSAIQTFLRIEKPEARGARPQPGHYKTIGQFYAAISEGIEFLCDKHGESHVFTGDAARQVQPADYYASGTLIVVNSRDSAHRAIAEIIEQGEGAHDSIFDDDHQILGEGGGREPSHYYRFMQLLLGKHYVPGDQPGKPPSGPPLRVDFDAVYPLTRNQRRTRYRKGSEVRSALDAFARSYGELLAALDHAFNGNPKGITEAMARMFAIKGQALALIRTPAGRKGGETVGLDFSP